MASVNNNLFYLRDSGGSVLIHTLLYDPHISIIISYPSLFFFLLHPRLSVQATSPVLTDFTRSTVVIQYAL